MKRAPILNSSTYYYQNRGLNAIDGGLQLWLHRFKKDMERHLLFELAPVRSVGGRLFRFWRTELSRRIR